MATHEVLWVTSFNDLIYQLSGHKLIRTFESTETEGTLVAFYESPFDDGCLPETVLRHDISQSPMLLEFLEKNRKVIHKKFGGDAGECDCHRRIAVPPNRNPEKARFHQPKCHNHLWNRNHPRWFRKVVAIKAATELYKARILCWVDADIRFESQVTKKHLERWLRNHAAFYFRSPSRSVLEAGFLCFDFRIHGDRWIRATAERYMSGAYRKDRRWDDSFQWQEALQRLQNIGQGFKARDLAKTAIELKKRVIEPTIGEFMSHDKGSHRDYVEGEKKL